VLGAAILVAAGCSGPAGDEKSAASSATAAAGRAGAGNAAPTEPPPGLAYVPPPPGSYELPPIQAATDGAVLDADGTARRLFDYFEGTYVLLSFIYLNCADAKGCPLATANLHLVRQDLESDPTLKGQVRLISLSFDPARDTPEALLRHWGPDYLKTEWRARPWSLLTTRSRADLEPILDGYGQYIVREVDESGRETGDYSHVLKVFLIDRQKRVRNIYTSDYLHPAIAMGDLRTLVMEDSRGGWAAR
jgi:cytochrome c peroxidase